MSISRCLASLVLVVALLLLTVTGCGRVQQETSEAKALNVALFQAPASEALAELIPQFEEENGIDINFELLPYAELKSKVEQQFFANTGAYDVVMADCIWIPSFAARGFLAEVDSSVVEIERYGFEDILPALDDYLSRYPQNGPRYGMPFMSNTHMMTYRAPLVEPIATSMGLKLPAEAPETAWSWQTYLKVAEAITAGNEGMSSGVYGTSLQARAGAWIVYEWYSVLFGFVDNPQARVTGLPAFGKEAAEAMAFYGAMYGAAPKAALTWGHEEETSAMCAGTTAMDATSNVELAASLLEPECNPAELRFAYPPVGVTQKGSPDMGGYGLLVSKQASDISLASRFVLWAASKDIHRRIVLDGGSPIRLSEVQDGEILSKFPYLSFYDRLIEESVYRARIPKWPELQDIISRELTAVMKGNKQSAEAVEVVQDWVDANTE